MTKKEIISEDHEVKLLLKDIIVFLDNEIKDGDFSEEIKLSANALSERCKRHIEEESVSDVEPPQSADLYNTSYVDMELKTRKIQDEYIETDIHIKEDLKNQETLYQNPSLNFSEMNEEIKVCPYSNLPAEQVNICEKNGPLIKREKFFFIEHHKKIYAALQETFLLLYFSEKDTKPFRTIDLTDYEVKIQKSNVKEKKKGTMFELFSLNKKSYQFLAQSEDEAIEWFKAINGKLSKGGGNYFKSATVVKRNLPPLPKPLGEKYESNTYEIVDTEVDYSEIQSQEKNAALNLEEKKNKEILIPLPPRIPDGVCFKSPLKPTKKIIKRHDKKSSKKFPFISNNYDPVQSVSIYTKRDEQKWHMQSNSSLNEKEVTTEIIDDEEANAKQNESFPTKESEKYNERIDHSSAVFKELYPTKEEKNENNNISQLVELFSQNRIMEGNDDPMTQGSKLGTVFNPKLAHGNHKRPFIPTVLPSCSNLIDRKNEELTFGFKNNLI